MELFLQQAQFVGLASLRYVVVHEDFDEDITINDYHDAWNLIREGEGTDSKFYVYENKFALPRTYLVNSYMIAHNEEESLRKIKENIADLSYSVVLENGEPSFVPEMERSNPGQARIEEYGINEVVLHVEADRPSLVVLTDSYYPGWNAFVDGARRPIWRANSLFRAVEVPAGNHTVIFKYQPASLRWGATISLITLLLVLAGLFAERHYARRRSGV